jgi:protease-4
VWDEVTGAIAGDSGRSVEAVRAWLSERPLRADVLLAEGFIHATGHTDTIEQDLEELVGRPVRFTTDLTGAYGATWIPANQIAVLHIGGGIISGSGGQSLFGHKTGTDDVDRAIEEIAGNPAIRAVVLRIDSPGGSAHAAERIHDAVRRLDERLPVVVSMGDVAASGGYYVASIDAPIHASPQTLTGSIGIYAGNLALDELLGRIGVNRDSSERGGRASYFDGRAWSEEDRLAVRAHIESAYDLFIDRVAEARDLSSDDVRAVAEGRIWSGRDAAERGLVDGIDGFLGALDAARSAGGIRDDAPVSLVHYPRPRFGVGAMIGQAVQADLEVEQSVRDWIGRLGMRAFAEHASAIEPGAPMAQLEWVLEQL